MAKHKKHYRKSFTVPVALAVPVAWVAYNTGKQLMGTNDQKEIAMAGLTGYDSYNKKWRTDLAIATYGPVVGGLVVHWAATRFGLNRKLAAAKIPVLRV